MAQLLIDCLSDAGYHVDIASRLRMFVKEPGNHANITALKRQARTEVRKLTELWAQQGPPALWFCYHPYYKSPDLLGPPLCEAFNIPYVTAEASYSRRRAEGEWASLQELVTTSINAAAVNICFTERDKVGLVQGAPSAILATLRPFIDTSEFTRAHQCPSEPHLVTVAMMRPGDKMQSYLGLAAALERLLHLRWSLSVVGDGPMRDEVRALFARFPTDRILWHGQLDHTEIATLLARSTLFVWPGCGEAYGLAYLEAQAAGLPVVAYDNAGVPEVVDTGYSGILTPAGDDKAYAAAIENLINDEQKICELSRQARLHVQRKHGFNQASKMLRTILHHHLGSLT